MLREEVPSRHGLAMRQFKRGDVDVTDTKGPGNEPRLRNEVASGPRAGMESVGEHALEVSHGFRTGVDGEGSPSAKIAKPSAVIQAHDVVGVSMREDDRVQPANIFAKHLQAKLGRRIDNDLCVV